MNRRIAILMALAAGTLYGWQTSMKFNLDHLAAKAVEKAEISLDANMIRMAGGMMKGEGDEAKAKKVLSGVNGLYVRSFKFAKEGEYSQADLDAVRAQLKAPEWNRIVNVEEKNESVQVYIKPGKEKAAGFALIAAEPKELTIVHIDGSIDLSDVGALKNLGIPAVHLGSKPAAKKDD